MSRLGAIRAIRALPILLAFGLAQASHCQTNAATSADECDVTTEEYAVYSAVLSGLAKPETGKERRDTKNQFYLSDKTTTSFGGSETRPENAKWSLHSGSTDKPSKATADSFNSKADSSCRLKRSLELNFQHVLIPGDEIRGFFENGSTGWSKFYEKYGKASGYWELSRAGFNDENSEAVVYVSHHCGGRCGTGDFVLLRKEAGQWAVKNRVLLWIS
jgi:hypothetical protein